MNKRVCVIGAGVSGLVTIKELSCQNIVVKCFEKQNGPFGAFRSIEDGGRSYDSLVLTVSNYFMSFSDFMPKEKESRRYLKVSEYRNYLDDYIKYYDLSKYIYTLHEVISAKYKDNKVFVTVANTRNEFTEVFDHLIVCSGSNFRPRLPQWKNEHLYKGSILHSSEYKNADNFRGKNVLCIGLGESGADIVHEISQITSCKVLIRDYPNVIPRWIKGFTNDAFTSYCFYSMGLRGINYFMKIKSWYYLNFNKKLNREERLIQKWTLKRKKFMGKFFTKNDVFLKDIVDNRIELFKDELKSFIQSGIITRKGKRIEADVVVCNTGYKTIFENFSFGKNFANPRKLFKQMIHPEYGSVICLVGWARPTQGGLPACSEAQARYIAQIISGKKKLPKVIELKRTIKIDENYYKDLFHDSRNINSLVSYHEFMIGMSKLIGCKPRLFYLKDLRLTKKIFFGSHLPAFYRLSDSATKQSAINTIKSLPIAYSKRRAITILIFILIFNPLSRISNLLSRI